MLTQNNSLAIKNPTGNLSRRIFTLGLLALPFTSPVNALTISNTGQRRLSFHHTHTGNRLSIVYHNGQSTIQRSIEKINQFLSDFRTGEVHDIDPRLLDALYLLQRKSATENPFEVISAYRSAKTNALLRNKSKGVAKRSLHMQGKAIDIRLPGVKTSSLRNMAMAMQLGGVGYYRRSDFIHIDTGRVRYW